MKMTFANLNDRVQAVFGSEDNYEGFRNLREDLRAGVKMYNEEGQEVSKKEAESKILTYSRQILGLNENSTKRDIHRALKKYGHEFFEVIEEDIDVAVEEGFRADEWFDKYVDNRNLKRGDKNEFWTDQEVILSAVKVSGDHHDYTVQRLGAGEATSATISKYGIAVGADVSLYLAGRLDWNKFVQQTADAFVRKIKNDCYAAVMNAGTTLPSMFKGTGALSSATKETFDQLIEDVSTANGNCPVYIMGTNTALKKLNALADVQWADQDAKKAMSHTGRLGDYEGTSLLEIPQRFAVGFVDLPENQKRLIASNQLLIMPAIEDKFVKLVDEGETEINEVGVGEKAVRMDDTQVYEVQRGFGVMTQIGRYFATWTF